MTCLNNKNDLAVIIVIDSPKLVAMAARLAAKIHILLDIGFVILPIGVLNRSDYAAAA